MRFYQILTSPISIGLSQVGKRQALELGKWLRFRYDGFLSSSHTRREAIFKTSGVDRAIQTGQVVAAGIYPPAPHDPKSDWDPSREINWQPIPFHVAPDRVRNILFTCSHRMVTIIFDKFEFVTLGEEIFTEHSHGDNSLPN